jgi:transposase-like protein
MSSRFTQSFKKQAVEKALNRQDNTTLKEVADSLGVGLSSLTRWIHQAKNQELEPISPNKVVSMKEKCPQDWTLEERLNMIISCGALDDEALSEHCREQGIYLHHVAQWKLDFANGNLADNKPISRNEIKILKHENKALKKELNRKDKALAETAALLVLQKKSTKSGETTRTAHYEQRAIVHCHVSLASL